MEDELFGWEEHEAFMAGSEDMELYCRRQEAEECARQEAFYHEEECRERHLADVERMGGVALALLLTPANWRVVHWTAESVSPRPEAEDDIPF